MRIALDLDDQLLVAANREAGSRGITLSDLVSEALRAALPAPPAAADAPFEMPTFGRSGERVDHTPSDLADE